tara:strand:- start:14962 stop:15498 length:537 start_codon:yes stop_codon:yes gene_type:complete
VTENQSKSLILYSSVNGHTKNICEYIKDKLKDQKNIVLSSMEEYKNNNLDEFDQITIGASVRYGYHRKNVYEFIRTNKDLLDTKKTCFFSVNLTARKPEKSSPGNNPYILKFLKKVNWEPSVKSVFAGKLDYPSLDCANKLAILFIMVITNGPKDISQVYELTDWSRVDELANSLLTL